MNELPLTSMEITDFFHAEHESIFFFDEDVRNHIKQVSELVSSLEEINDDVSGMDEVIFNELKRKELSDKAQDLFLESIDLYERYIDFCDVGKADSRKNKK